MVGLSDGGLVYIQVKHTLDLQSGGQSDLAKTIDEFVRQATADQNGGASARLRNRPLDVTRDRLVIAMSSRSSASLREHFPAVLRRVRSLTEGQVLAEAARNQRECRALDTVISHIRTSWKSATGSDSSAQDIRRLLCLTHVLVLDVDPAGTNEDQAKQTLAATLLQEPSRADIAWHMLIQACAGFARDRAGADRASLQQQLLNAGIALRSAPSYRADIDRLRSWTAATTSALRDLSEIRVGDSEVKVHRRSTDVLLETADQGAVVVVGQPGGGKSGVLHDLVELLQRHGQDVVCFAVDRLAAQSVAALAREIGLTHDLIDVLDNWPGSSPGFLVVDALDAARDGNGVGMVRDLLCRIARTQRRWHIVASIREFDLRHSPHFRELFRGQPTSGYPLPGLAGVRHLAIPPFNDEELAEVGAQCPDLATLVAAAPGPLRELLAVSFNLRLVADLLGTGVRVQDITPIRTQVELLDRYWERRVELSPYSLQDGQGYAREEVLRMMCEEMVKQRALRVSARQLPLQVTSLRIQELLQSRVIIEWDANQGSARRTETLAFSHNYIFDYAVERLLLRDEPTSLVGRLEEGPDPALVLRPSIVLHFTQTWYSDASRAAFWDLALTVLASDRIPEVARLIGPAVAADLVARPADYQPLVAALAAAMPRTRGLAEAALRHLLTAVLASQPHPSRPLVGPNAPPWTDLLEQCSRTMRDPIAYAIQPMLVTICERPDEMAPNQRAAVGSVSRRLLDYAWSS